MISSPWSAWWPFAGLSSVCSSLSCSETPELGIAPQMHLTNAHQRGIIVSLDLLATVLANTFKNVARGHCRLMSCLLPNRTRRSFSRGLLPRVSSQPILVHAVIPGLAYIFLNFMRFLFAHFSSLFCSLWVANLPSSILAALPDLALPADLSALCAAIRIRNEDTNQYGHLEGSFWLLAAIWTLHRWWQ